MRVKPARLSKAAWIGQLLWIYLVTLPNGERCASDEPQQALPTSCQGMQRAVSADFPTCLFSEDAVTSKQRDWESWAGWSSWMVLANFFPADSTAERLEIQLPSQVPLKLNWCVLESNDGQTAKLLFLGNNCVSVLGVGNEAIHSLEEAAETSESCFASRLLLAKAVLLGGRICNYRRQAQHWADVWQSATLAWTVAILFCPQFVVFKRRDYGILSSVVSSVFGIRVKLEFHKTSINWIVVWKRKKPSAPSTSQKAAVYDVKQNVFIEEKGKLYAKNVQTLHSEQCGTLFSELWKVELT